MLLSVWLKFISQPSCGADGIQMYPRPPGNRHGEEKRPSRVECRIKEKSLHISNVQNSLFPNDSYLSFDLLQLAKVILCPFHNGRNWFSELSDLPVVLYQAWESCIMFSSVQAFQVFYHLLSYYPYFTKDKRLFLAVIYSGKFSEVRLRKKIFPGQNLSKFRISAVMPHKT